MWFFFFSSFTIWPVTGTAFCVPCICLFACVSKNWNLWKTKLHNLRLSCNCWPRKQTIVSEHDPRGDFRFYLCSVLKQNLCFSVLPEPRAATCATESSPVYHHFWGKLGWNKHCIFKTEEHQFSHKAQHRRCQSDPLASSPHLLRFFFYPPDTDSKLASGWERVWSGERKEMEQTKRSCWISGKAYACLICSQGVNNN